MNRRRLITRPRSRSRRSRVGFTLMEVLLVLAILVILASLVSVSYISFSRTSKVDSTRAQLGLLEQALEAYHLNIGKYPDSNQGLGALIQPPGDLRNPTKWQGPYLKKALPLDPWDNNYMYESAGADQYRIWSAGPNAENENGVGDDIYVQSY